MLRSILTVAGLVFLMPLAADAAAEQQRIETITAGVHASMAKAADTLPSTRAHFHHVLNCLVDPDNRLFDRRSENPCASMGSSAGALRDEAKTDALKKDLQHAVEVAERGTRARSLEAAHVYAEWLAEILSRASN
jgi:hypothetical protein